MPSLTKSLARGDGGFVAIMTALLSLVLVVSVAFTVDVGNWNIHENRQQAAAEAAALGGVPFLPGDPVTAEAVARDVAARHGYSDPGAVNVGIGAAPNQLWVSITDTVPAYFAHVIGMSQRVITERSTAEFLQGAQLGSPEIGLGNDPEHLAKPDYWVAIAGPDAGKVQGDRFQTLDCTAGVYACSSGLNSEYDPEGYRFIVRVTDASTPWRIQVYDAPGVLVGNVCEWPYWMTGPEESYLKTLDDGSNSQIPLDYYEDASTRYIGGDSTYCTGDAVMTSPEVTTVFTVRAPDDTPWDDLDNPVVTSCPALTFGSYEPKSPYVPGNWSVFEYLDPASGADEWQVNPTDGRLTFAETFRRWFTICELNPGPELVAGDYIVQVQTIAGGSQNRFSLRAGPASGSDDVLDIGQSMFATKALPTFANTVASDTKFYLARVTPATSGRLLEVTFFDVGDAANAGQIQILPPVDSPLAHFDGCTFVRSDVGTLTSTSLCGLTDVQAAAGYNGTLVTAQVPIPPNYACDYLDPDGCWLRVRIQFPTGVTDFSTWTVRMSGEPVRIIE
jgi:hypothetical protein